MSTLLKNKKILFIAPIFYNYHTLIAKSIVDIGGHVDFIQEKEYGIIPNFLKYLSKSLNRSYSNNKLRKRIFDKKNEDYDFIFVIHGEFLNRRIINSIKKTFNRAQLIAYHWDSFLFNPTAKGVIDLYDKVFSFDRRDVFENKNIFYKALFYTDESIVAQTNDESVDLLFIGVDYSDRYRLVMDIHRISQDIGIKFNHYIITSLVSFWRKKILSYTSFKDVSKEDFVFHKIQYPDFIRLTLNSKAVLDINFKGQAGLTMRTIEVLSMGKKLVTTNEFIRQEPFFDPRSILIIDRDNPSIDKAFINQPNYRLEMRKYHLSEWIKEFFI